MKKIKESVIEKLAALTRYSSCGYAIAADIEFTTPRFLFQTYPREWQEEYSAGGMVMRDPTVAWGISHEGQISWSDLHDRDPSFFRAAERHGLVHGFTISRKQEPLRSIASFARSDRPFTSEELAAIEDEYLSLLELLKDVKLNHPHEVAGIAAISLALTH